jgi:hypothetical protein
LLGETPYYRLQAGFGSGRPICRYEARCLRPNDTENLRIHSHDDPFEGLGGRFTVDIALMNVFATRALRMSPKTNFCQ